VSEVSADTARFLLQVLGGMALNVGAPDFDQVVAQVLKARAELLAIAAEDLPGEEAPSQPASAG